MSTQSKREAAGGWPVLSLIDDCKLSNDSVRLIDPLTSIDIIVGFRHMPDLQNEHGGM
jgi:hypothetical protein